MPGVAGLAAGAAAALGDFGTGVLGVAGLGGQAGLWAGWVAGAGWTGGRGGLSTGGVAVAGRLCGRGDCWGVAGVAAGVRSGDGRGVAPARREAQDVCAIASAGRLQAKAGREWIANEMSFPGRASFRSMLAGPARSTKVIVPGRVRAGTRGHDGVGRYTWRVCACSASIAARSSRATVSWWKPATARVCRSCGTCARAR